MRMWNVNPQYMCNKHLLGEHLEMHMFAGSIKKGTKLDGFVAKGLVDTDNIKPRHDALAAEMMERGMRHSTPMAQAPVIKRQVSVDHKASLTELLRRCVHCRMRHSRATAE